MEKLIKVRFTLERLELSLGNYGFFVGEPDSDANEVIKERIGFFHCFSNEPFYDPEAQCLRDLMVGIVEEESTGHVYHVIPQFMTFEL